MIATGRPKKTGVDYFSHDVDASSSSKTIFTLEKRFGNDGYAFWFKLLELLGSQDGHFYDCNNEPDWIFFVAKTNVDEVSATEILDLLARMGAIDPDLWQMRVIWCQNFVDRLSEVYRKRGTAPPKKPDVDSFWRGNNQNDDVSAPESTQSKVKESKVKQSKDKTAAAEACAPAREETHDGKPVPSGTRDVPPSSSESAVSQPSFDSSASGVPSPTDVPSSGSASAVLQTIADEFALATGQKYALLCNKYAEWAQTFDDEVISIALNEALEHNAKTVKYLDAVLKNWQALGLTSAVSVRDHLNHHVSVAKKTSKGVQENFKSQARDLSWLAE